MPNLSLYKKKKEKTTKKKTTNDNIKLIAEGIIEFILLPKVLVRKWT